MLLSQAASARRAGRHADAEEVFREWMRRDPADPAPRYGLSTLLLQRGAYAEGWELYEARAEVPETGIRKPQLTFPEWRGEEVGSLLVLPEQGLGDQIMFARFIPELVARGIKVTLLSPPPLARLFQQLGAQVLVAAGSVSMPHHDAWCLIGSLPHRIGTIPTGPYLPSAPGGVGLGVMPTGNPNHVNDADRSLPEPYAAQLLQMGRDLRPDATGARDFADTAEIISDLRGVISVDTAVAHLAGAMGKPVAILLGRDPDWRWGLGERTIWYPSARLIRRVSEWSEALDQARTSMT